MSSADGPWNPASIGVDEFLAGPDRFADDPDDDGDGPEADLLDIDDIFAKDFARVLAEQREAAASYGAASPDPEPDAVATPSLKAPGYRFVEVEAGVILLSPSGEAVGGYIGPDVSVAEEHQGKGLGAELVLELAMRRGGLPTWDLDTASYSRAGVGAHRAAHALARNPAFFAAKSEALQEAMAQRSPAPAP
jgi:GNAT superfamily N-acetyltransferase